MKILNKFMFWLKASILVIFLIAMLIGFGFGYIYNDYVSGACVERPLSYGIEKINDMNNASFTCACTSLSGSINPFYFNESGTFTGTFLDSQITIIP